VQEPVKLIAMTLINILVDVLPIKTRFIDSEFAFLLQLISWGNVWLTDRWSLIKRLIGGDLGRWVMARCGHLEHSHSQMFYNCTAL